MRNGGSVDMMKLKEYGERARMRRNGENEVERARMRRNGRGDGKIE